MSMGGFGELDEGWEFDPTKVGGGPQGLATAFSIRDSNGGSSWTLSNSNKTAIHASANWETIRTNNANSAGQWYLEFKCTVAGSDVNYGFGFGSSAFLANAAQGGTVGNCYLGTSNYSGGIFCNGAGIITSGMTAGTGTLPTANPALNDLISLAVDFTAGKIWAAKNGSFVGSGNPATGANPQITFTPATVGPLYAGVSCGTTLGGTWTIQATSASQTYSPPVGFTAWG